MDEIDSFLIKIGSQLKRKWKGRHIDEIRKERERGREGERERERV